MINQFKIGLRGEIDYCVGQQRYNTYVELLEQCYIAEQSLKKIEQEKEQAKPSQENYKRPNQHLRPRGAPSKYKPNQNLRPSHSPFCNKCKRNHVGGCKGSEGVTCFNCGKKGHFAWNCSNRSSQGGNTRRVYTLDAKKAKSNNELIAGTCLLNNQTCLVLIDCGASNSFISPQCVQRIGLEMVPLDSPMVVGTAVDGSVETSRKCEDCIITVDDRVFQVDLICLPLKRVDVVLGMDWLSANSVLINCKERAILVPAVVTAPEDSMTTLLEEVFPEDVTSLPPEREVEFSIDLVPGTALVSVAPYRMSPIELKELKSQLFIFQTLYQTQCFSLGSSSFISQEEGRWDAIVYRLPPAK
ncbi:uncharacterized protein LOC131613734 [Vicia villosa]|uniref:uncharacterized protein LOC131613734 n=1 Tax=Vicia villosa TaxID=3911 RepID=UPI00273B5FAC|nr:uncharacterized protein LOC131613734 [Vicia villosa]